MSLKTSRSYLLLICLLAYVLAGLTGLILLQNIEGHILFRLLIADVGATLIIFVIGTALKNSSLYDPYWSLAPPLLIAGYAIAGGGVIGIPRGAIVALLVLIWAWRLTWNCMRRWPNLAHEDFRYVDKRAQLSRFYSAVDLFGIQLFPTVLVFAGCLPLYPIFVHGGPHWNVVDFLALFVMSGAIAVEWHADRTLWKFKKTASEGALLDTGLWALARHPNYFGELAFWGGLFLFALGVGFEYWWTGIGFAAMFMLFRFISIPLMEARKEARRLGYADTVKDKPLLIPWPRKSN